MVYFERELCGEFNLILYSTSYGNQSIDFNSKWIGWFMYSRVSLEINKSIFRLKIDIWRFGISIIVTSLFSFFETWNNEKLCFAAYFKTEAVVRKCSLKLASAIFYQIVIFQQMIALQKLWKMFFISSKKLFSFSRYSNFCIFVSPSFFPCQSLL